MRNLRSVFIWAMGTEKVLNSRLRTRSFKCWSMEEKVSFHWCTHSARLSVYGDSTHTVHTSLDFANSMFLTILVNVYVNHFWLFLCKNI